MKQSGKFFPGWPADDKDARKAETTGQYVNLTLADGLAQRSSGHPDKERGYNPYDNGHARDVWRHKPKRA